MNKYLANELKGKHLNDAQERIAAWRAAQRPAINLGYKQPEAPLPVGASKLFGCPDVPAEFEWPRFKIERNVEDSGRWWGILSEEEKAEKEEERKRREAVRPLAFIAQLDLAELSVFDAASLLPKAGLLSFFWDLECAPSGSELTDKGAVRVFYFPPGTKLERVPLPDDMVENCFIPEFEPVFSPRDSLPSTRYLPIKLRLAVDDDDDTNWPGYCKLLGWGDAVQDLVEGECRRIFNEPGGPTTGQQWCDFTPEEDAGDWILLLQMGDDMYCPGYWDGGVVFGEFVLYMCIRRQDLAALNFENVWALVQNS